MEEVDSTILHFLRQLNINDVKKISNQPVEVVESATKFVSDTSQKVPSGVSQRNKAAAKIASICKNSGYQNDVGYQTYLYHNGFEFGKVFMLLVQKVPSEDKTQTAKVQSVNKKDTLFKDIRSKIAKGFNTIRVLLCCRPSTQSTAGDFVHNKDKYEYNESFKELKELTISLRQQLDTFESERNILGAETSETQQKYVTSAARLKNVLNILSQAGMKIESDGIDKLYQNISKSQQTIEEISSMNLYLKVRIEKLKSLNSLSELDGAKCRNTLVNLKESAKAIKEECEKKDEIIGNIDTKDSQAEKIVEDTTKLQKQIYTFRSELLSCVKDINICDEAKRAYELLDVLYFDSDTIVKSGIASTVLYRYTIELKDNLEAEMSKIPVDTLNKILSDLANLQEEN